MILQTEKISKSFSIFRPKVRTVSCGTVEASKKNVACETDEQILMMTTITGITIAPSTVSTVAQTPGQQNDVPSLSLKDMNKLPVQRTSATQTQNILTHQQATQSSPIVINKATDSNDLVRVVHKMSMTEVLPRRDQMVHTGDLIKIHQTGTNTPPPLVAITRSTASNTNNVSLKSVGINCEAQVETLGNLLNHQGNSKIPRPSPMAQRKFVRQETFTVSSPPESNEEKDYKECPAEILLK